MFSFVYCCTDKVPLICKLPLISTDALNEASFSTTRVSLTVNADKSVAPVTYTLLLKDASFVTVSVSRTNVSANDEVFVT